MGSSNSPPAAEKVETCCIVASLLSSEPKDQADALGKKIVSDMYDIFQRQLEEAVQPVEKDDVAEVLRRRLFDPKSVELRGQWPQYVIAALKRIASLDDQTAKSGFRDAAGESPGCVERRGHDGLVDRHRSFAAGRPDAAVEDRPGRDWRSDLGQVRLLDLEQRWNEIKARSNVAMKFQVRLELGDGTTVPSDDVVAEVNGLLKDLDEGFHVV